MYDLCGCHHPIPVLRNPINQRWFRSGHELSIPARSRLAYQGRGSVIEHWSCHLGWHPLGLASNREWEQSVNRAPFDFGRGPCQQSREIGASRREWWGHYHHTTPASLMGKLAGRDRTPSATRPACSLRSLHGHHLTAPTRQSLLGWDGQAAVIHAILRGS